MDAAKNVDDHMTSAAAFVEGGVQEACDDACSICLEDFSQNDPSSVTNCRHEFHLQCILEWCQRSSNCPMCWQPISLKDTTSQELLKAVEHERISKSNISRHPTVFHHPILGDFDLQQLRMGADEVELEEHIFQHLAAAAAMRRGHHSFLREGRRNRSSSQDHHPFFIFTSPSPSQSTVVSSSTSSVGEGSESAAVSLQSASMPYPNNPDARALPVSFSPAQTDQLSAPRAASNVAMVNEPRISSETRSLASHPSTGGEDTGGPSDLQSLSESLKTRFNSWSTRYKESLSRNTRGWKERLFPRSNSMADIGPEVRREVNASIARVSRLMERLDSRENNRAGNASGPSDGVSRNNRNDSENPTTPMSDSKMSASCATSSASD